MKVVLQTDGKIKRASLKAKVEMRVEEYPMLIEAMLDTLAGAHAATREEMIGDGKKKAAEGMTAYTMDRLIRTLKKITEV
jgi:hypothetical protein